MRVAVAIGVFAHPGDPHVRLRQRRIGRVHGNQFDGHAGLLFHEAREPSCQPPVAQRRPGSNAQPALWRGTEPSQHVQRGDKFRQQRLAGFRERATAAWLMLAATAPMVVLPAWSARAAARVSPARFFGTGLATVAAGAGLVAVGAAAQSLGAALAGMFLGGAATALLAAQALAGVVGAVPPDQAGAASAVTVILRHGGFALGIAMLTVVARAHGGGHAPDAAVFAWACIVTAGAAVLVTALLRARIAPAVAPQLQAG